MQEALVTSMLLRFSITTLKAKGCHSENALPFVLYVLNKEVDLMPYQNPLELLSSGKVAWNKWRKAYADVQAFEPDLHEAQLRDVNLHGADLHRADLTEADLQGSDLREANLEEVDLRHANLQGADLSDANLQHARLHGADFRNATLFRANLKGADLSNADLRGADLREADLEKAILNHTQFDAVSAPDGNLSAI
jgi:uncharacterized protein YjbI with pentapeptide repeats